MQYVVVWYAKFNMLISQGVEFWHPGVVGPVIWTKQMYTEIVEPGEFVRHMSSSK